MYTICLVIISLLIAQCSLFCLPGLTAKTTKPQTTTSSAAPKYRPRVVYFYADRCPACRHYGPLLKSTVNPYLNYVDFQSFNVDDPKYSSLVSRLQIHSIPTTFVYNNQGHKVFEQAGNIDQESIYDVLRGVYEEDISKPVKKKS
jgi:thioredoxin-like negative regulator of GroEL